MDRINLTVWPASEWMNRAGSMDPLSWTQFQSLSNWNNTPEHTVHRPVDCRSPLNYLSLFPLSSFICQLLLVLLCAPPSLTPTKHIGSSLTSDFAHFLSLNKLFPRKPVSLMWCPLAQITDSHCLKKPIVMRMPACLTHISNMKEDLTNAHGLYASVGHVIF